MSDDEAAFLRTIRENPDADLPRLVYADYLEEQGHQLRAQFLRAHLELERLTEDSPRRRELAFWCRTQLDTQSHLLFEPPLQPKFARYGRGLIEAAVFWNASDGEIASAFHLAPLRRIWVYGLDRWLSQLKRVPVENCLHTLDLTGNRLTADALRYLGTVMRFPHLKELVLTGCDLDDEAARVLCERTPFRELERIHVGGNPLAEGGQRQLRSHFGERIRFQGVGNRSIGDGDPDGLHTLQPNFRLHAGTGKDQTQILCVASEEGVQFGTFDYAGNVIEVRLVPTSGDELAGILDTLGYSPAPVHLKPFEWTFGGLRAFPTGNVWELNVLTDPAGTRTPAELAEARDWLDSWLRDGFCELSWYPADYTHFARDGETI